MKLYGNDNVNAVRVMMGIFLIKNKIENINIISMLNYLLNQF